MFLAFFRKKQTNIFFLLFFFIFSSLHYPSSLSLHSTPLHTTPLHTLPYHTTPHHTTYHSQVMREAHRTTGLPFIEADPQWRVDVLQKLGLLIPVAYRTVMNSVSNPHHRLVLVHALVYALLLTVIQALAHSTIHH